MKQRKLSNRGPEVSNLGLGCMSMRFGYGATTLSRIKQIGAANVQLDKTDLREIDGALANAPIQQPSLSEVHMGFTDR